MQAGSSIESAPIVAKNFPESVKFVTVPLLRVQWSQYLLVITALLHVGVQ